ncbi:hypothetical protein LguiB_021407 [Lonicera macranthoides]
MLPRSSLPDPQICDYSGRKSEHYALVNRLIRLVLILPVSTTTIEMAFSCMKHVKTVICNSMGDEFLADCLTLYIERGFTLKIDIDSVIEEFETSKIRQA